LLLLLVLLIIIITPTSTTHSFVIKCCCQRSKRTKKSLWWNTPVRTALSCHRLKFGLMLSIKFSFRLTADKSSALRFVTANFMLDSILRGSREETGCFLFKLQRMHAFYESILHGVRKIRHRLPTTSTHVD